MKNKLFIAFASIGMILAVCLFTTNSVKATPPVKLDAHHYVTAQGQTILECAWPYTTPCGGR